jgi:hypothetical protein
MSRIKTARAGCIQLNAPLEGSLDQLPNKRSAGGARLVSGMQRDVVRLDSEPRGFVPVAENLRAAELAPLPS